MNETPDLPGAVRLRAGDALLVVDLQRDFLPGGALAVPDGDRVVPALNRYLERFEREGLLVVLTRDWHPTGHVSFNTRGGPWPPHCVAGTPGAEFAPGPRLPASAQICSKATQPDAEAYSGFEGTELAASLRQQGIKRLFVGGLATDYCVRTTVLDALREGFEVLLLVDAIRPVEVQPGDGARAEQAMLQAGARPIRFEQLAGPGT
ncbi:nicotinamidase [Malikia sp.]|uniref:nicotinamidase n=1 Tax=Malikia sp. TaxID=2070706 RepID=UPI002630E87F|nr:nicotinamidase [Malikia sp.]MDD2729616.1 nicotinamidase [Malikia sp.]